MKRLKKKASKEKLQRRRLRKLKKRKRILSKKKNKLVLWKQKISGRRYRTCVAPPNFSFINNTENLLHFAGKIATNIQGNKPVKIDLENISHLTPDAIAFLCALVNKSKRGLIKGNAPKNSFLQQKFVASGFYDYVKTFKKPPVAKNNKMHHNKSLKKVDPLIAKECTLFALGLVKKNEIKKALYEILIELMANTNNHANLSQSGMCDWWLYYYYDSATRTMHFTFLDFGVGVFRSKKFKKFLGMLNKTTEEKACDLLEGKIESRTGLSCRGKGFSCIVENAGKNLFNKFVIVTNDALIDVKTRNTKTLNQEFNGTFFYWEIRNDDQNLI